MPSGELRLLAGVLRQTAALRTDRWVGAHLRHDPEALRHTRAGIADPYPVYERLRAQGRPFVRLHSGVRATVEHRWCREVLRSREFGVRPPGDRGPTEPSASAEFMDLGMLERDPPDHTRLRRLVAPAFTPRAIQSQRRLVEQTADELLDRAGARFDLVADYAAPLPVRVIAALLGLDPGDAPALARHGLAITSAIDGIRSPGHLRALLRAADELGPAFAGLIERRRREPADDLVSALVTAEDGGTLTEYELVVMCHLLLVAGFETTVNLIGNAVAALLDRPPLWAALRADPALAGAVVEEVLRYDPPVQATYRVAHREVELGGQRFRPGHGVIVFLGGAGRDPQAYPRPRVVELDRPGSADHLAFSAGIHYCVGAPLARLEAEVALRRLAQRMPDLVRSGRGSWRPAATIRGYAHLPVRAA